MAQEDLRNNRSIRTVLVRHWIDLGRIGISSACGRVTIRGTMQLLRGVKHELDAQEMENIQREINRISEIKRLTFELENWAFLDGCWHKLDRAKTDNPNFESNNSSTYEI